MGGGLDLMNRPGQPLNGLTALGLIPGRRHVRWSSGNREMANRQTLHKAPPGEDCQSSGFPSVGVVQSERLVTTGTQCV